LQGLLERCEADLTLRIVPGPAHEYADTPHPLGLLRTRCERPRRHRTAKQRDELAPFPLTEMHPIPLTGR